MYINFDIGIGFSVVDNIYKDSSNPTQLHSKEEKFEWLTNRVAHYFLKVQTGQPWAFAISSAQEYAGLTITGIVKLFLAQNPIMKSKF